MLNWQYPYPTHHLALSGQIDVAYVDEGQGRPLLFIHGLGSNLKGWWKNIEGLKSRFRCIALDLPGYGKSSKGDFPFSMTFFAESIREFIEKMGLENVVLVGHSMGGQVAMHTVLRSEKNIEKLVLLAPAGFETFIRAERQFFAKLYTPSLLKSISVAQIARNFEINFHRMPADARFMIDDRLSMRKTEEFDHFCRMVSKCLLAMLDESVFDFLPRIQSPTLVLFGKRDFLIPNRMVHPLMSTEQVAKKGSKRIRGSQLRLIEKAGHFLQWERAERVNEEIREFLR